jgi:hypothetical protein
VGLTDYPLSTEWWQKGTPPPAAVSRTWTRRRQSGCSDVRHHRRGCGPVPLQRRRPPCVMRSLGVGRRQSRRLAS